MANTKTTTVLLAGKGEAIIYFNMVYVDTATDILYDSSAIAALIQAQDPTWVDPLNCSILEVHAQIAAAVTARAGLYFDATTDVLACALPVNVAIHHKPRKSVPWKNIAGAGITGDIVLTTSGLAAGDLVTIELHVRPK